MRPTPAHTAGGPATAVVDPATSVPSRGLGDFWLRACHLLVFLILILIPCLHALRLPEKTIDWLQSQSGAWWHRIYIEQINAFLNYGYSPLPLKEAAFSILVAMLLLCWYGSQLGRPWQSSGPSVRRFDWMIYGPIAVFLIWSAISLLYTPTFYYSLTTYGLVVAGVLWFVAVYELPKSQCLVRRWFNTVLVGGVIVAFFAFLQDIDRGRVITGWLFVDIERAARSDPRMLRLRMGSLIGHNIGVASFLSFSWFIVLSRLFQPATWKRKGVYVAILSLFFYVIAASQTRGVWIVLTVLTPAYLFWLARLTNRQFDLKPILGVVLIVLIILTLQTIPSPRNPFYSPESPLLLRFTHFTPAHLLTETRLRIAVCSGSLVAGRPLLGHGLGSFQYVFPAAQADYFAANPLTLLAPTNTRTMQAHSDWLQLVIELGFPGLLIVLVGLYLALRRGYNRWLRLGDAALRLEMTAALMGVAAVMFHALADFPIHVVSSAAPAIFMLAVWTGCARIERTDDRRAIRVKGEEPVNRADRTKGVLTAVGWLVLVLAAFGTTVWFYARLHASMYEVLGTGYRLYYGERAPEMTNQERELTLDAAYAALRQGNKIAPLDCEIIFRLGEVSALRGVVACYKYEKMRESDGATSEALEAARRDAARYLTRAVEWLDASRKEVQFHDLYHYLGLSHEQFWRLYGVEEARQRAKQLYRLAARYSPCYGPALYHLYQMLREDRPPNEEQLRQVCRQIARYAPDLFERQFIEPTRELVLRREYDKAALQYDVLRDALPDRVDLWIESVHVLAFAGRGAEATVEIETFRKAHGEIPERALLGYSMEAAAASGRWGQAVSFATAALAVPGSEPMASFYRCARAAALEKMGDPQAQSEWKEIERLDESDTRYRLSATEVWLFLIPNTDRAYPYLLRLCKSDPGPDAALYRIAAEQSYKRDQKQQALEFLGRSLKLDPDDPRAKRLLATFQP